MRRALFIVFLSVAIFAALTELASAQIGPILQIDSDPTDFDTTFCGTTKCRQLIFSNTGTELLNIYSSEQLPPHFIWDVTLPLTIAPGEADTFQVCYSPSVPFAIDDTTIILRADTRASLSITLLVDISSSMNDTIQDGAVPPITNIDAAYIGGVSFVRQLTDTLGIQDEAAVFTFETVTVVRQDFTTDKALLEAAVPSIANGTGTCMFAGLLDAVNAVAARNIPGRRVIIILTDGVNSLACTGSLNAVLNSANARGVRIFTIGVGTGVDIPTLNQLANGTGGRAFLTTTGSGVTEAYDSIAALLSRNITVPFTLLGESVAPRLEYDPPLLDFDSTRVHKMPCQQVRVINTGTAAMEILGISGFNPPYSTDVTSLPTLLPGQDTTITVCFSPERLRVQNDSGVISYRSCMPTDAVLPLMGIGYDSVVIELSGTYYGRPGSSIALPVILHDTIPEIYETDSLELTVRYNKTMLYPLTQPVVREESLTEPMARTAHQATFDTQDATLAMKLDGGRLVNPEPDSTLTRIGFLVLHGNAIETPVDIIAAKFADGNPKVGIITPATFVSDSLCYQEERLIDASARYDNSQTILVSGGSSAKVALHITYPAHTIIRLYDVQGKANELMLNQWMDEGNYELELDTGRLTPGTYFVEFTSGPYRSVKPLAVTR